MPHEHIRKLAPYKLLHRVILRDNLKGDWKWGKHVPRQLQDWVNGYLSFTENSESSKLYRKGCSLSIIASVLQRKCWIPFRRSTLYPNLYVVMVGGPGVRKSTAFEQVQKFTRVPELGIKLAVDSTSKVQLIKDFIAAVDITLMEDGKQYMHSSLTIHSPELTVFLGYQNLDLLTALTDWYDSNKNPWIYKTGNAGTNEINGVWANILGATTPDLLRSALPLVAIGGGLVGRMLLLYSPRREKKVFSDLPTKEEDALQEVLTQDLIEMSRMCGQFKFTPQFIDMATDFYDKFDEEEECKDHRFEGYFNRKIATLYKLSMIFSASRDNKMVVLAEDFQRGVEFLKEVENMMYWALQGIGRNALADVTTKIMYEIGRSNGSTVTKLMARFKDDITRHELDSVLQTLSAIGYCTFYTSSGRVEIKEGVPNAYTNGEVRSSNTGRGNHPLSPSFGSDS